MLKELELLVLKALYMLTVAKSQFLYVCIKIGIFNGLSMYL